MDFVYWIKNCFEEIEINEEEISIHKKWINDIIQCTSFISAKLS